MGNRISISFSKNGDESVSLFSHWDGVNLVAKANDYVARLKRWAGSEEMFPLQRLEPQTVLVDFLRELTKDEDRIKSNYYLGKDSNDGDNSDNGHFTIKL